jgi:hypothetical protein
MTAHELLLFTTPVYALLIGLFVYWLNRPSAPRNEPPSRKVRRG